MHVCAIAIRLFVFSVLDLSFRNCLLANFLIISADSTANGPFHRSSCHDYQLLADCVTSNRLPRPCVDMLAHLPNDTNGTSIIVALVLYIFHECGFVLFESPSGDSTSPIPTYWGYTNVTQIPEMYSTAAVACIKQQSQSETIYLKLLNFSDERLLLVIRRIGNDDVVCVSFCFRDQNRSVCLPINEFIQSEFQLTKIVETPNECLKNIDKLVNKIKSTIITPIRNAVMHEAGLHFLNLDGLPKEILWRILKRLDIKSLQQLSHTCAYMRNEVRSYLHENHINVTSTRRSTPIVRLPATSHQSRGHWFRIV